VNFFSDLKLEQEIQSDLSTDTSDIHALVKFKPVGELFGYDDSMVNERIQRKLYIVNNPTICQGEPIIQGTRISVSNIVELHHLLKWDISQIMDYYPHLTLDQIQASLEYYEEFPSEIDKYLQEEKEVDED